METLNFKIPAWHFPMLNDTERNEKYEKAIRNIVKDKVVIDLGSGSCLLSMIAVKYGAKKVYAIEQDQEICFLAQKIITQNNLDNKISIINKNLLQVNNTDIPVKADLVITEIFDCELIGEGCLNSINIIKNFLKPLGKILPNNGTIYSQVGESQSLRSKHILINNRVLDFDISPFLPLREIGAIECLRMYEPIHLVSNKVVLKKYNFNKNYDLLFKVNAKFNILKDSYLDYLALWFKITLSNSIVLENYPGSKLHWDQFLLFPDRVIKAKKGNTLYISLYIKNNMICSKDWILE